MVRETSWQYYSRISPSVASLKVNKRQVSERDTISSVIDLRSLQLVILDEVKDLFHRQDFIWFFHFPSITKSLYN